MNNHAKLSASGSHRWILCPGSVKAEEGLPNKTSQYAQEGINAHERAHKYFTHLLDLSNEDKSKNSSLYEIHLATNIEKNIDEEHIAAINYVKYVLNILLSCSDDAQIYIEKKVDFSYVIPEGFGTADCIIIDNNILHIIDFKFGKGLPVDAKNNTQLLLYALGACKIMLPNWPHEICMHIVQPRIHQISKWKINIAELLEWFTFLNRKAHEALLPNAPRIPSKTACMWCKAKSSCPAIYNFINKNVLPLTTKNQLTNEELKIVMDNSDLIKGFLTSIEEKIYENLEKGVGFKGYKLVKGRSVRKFKPEAIEELAPQLGDSIYKKIFITLAEAEKIFDKDTMNKITYKQEGKPILTTINDKREDLSINLKFDDLTNNEDL
jgi:predicted transport protein